VNFPFVLDSVCCRVLLFKKMIFLVSAFQECSPSRPFSPLQCIVVISLFSFFVVLYIGLSLAVPFFFFPLSRVTDLGHRHSPQHPLIQSRTLPHQWSFQGPFPLFSNSIPLSRRVLSLLPSQSRIFQKVLFQQLIISPP